MPMRTNIRNLRKNKMTEEVKNKQDEKKKAEMQKKIDKLVKTANEKANSILSIFEGSNRTISWVS